MPHEFYFNPRYPTPSEDVLARLKASKQIATQTRTRQMHCPICRFKIAIIPERQTDLVFVKCHKCGFQGALHPAYFRRVKRYREHINQRDVL